MLLYAFLKPQIDKNEIKLKEAQKKQIADATYEANQAQYEANLAAQEATAAAEYSEDY